MISEFKNEEKGTACTNYTRKKEEKMVLLLQIGGIPAIINLLNCVLHEQPQYFTPI